MICPVRGQLEGAPAEGARDSGHGGGGPALERPLLAQPDYNHGTAPPQAPDLLP